MDIVTTDVERPAKLAGTGTAPASEPARDTSRQELRHSAELIFKTPAGKSLAGALRTALDQTLDPPPGARAFSTAVWRRTVESLTAGLVQAQLSHHRGGLIISLATTSPAAGTSRYILAPLPPPKLQAAVEGFKAAGLATWEAGIDGQWGRLHPTAGFAAMASALGVTRADLGRSEAGLEVLLLRDAKQPGQKKGSLVQYVDTEKTVARRRVIEALNAWLEDADLSLAAPTARWDTTDRQLRFHFNRPVHAHYGADFTTGGRLYGGFWQLMSKAARLRHLRIEGQRVAIVDWSATGLRIAYGQCQVQPPAGDLYRMIGPWKREVLKQAVSTLLTARHGQRFAPCALQEMLEDDDEWQRLRKAILQRHPPIRTLLGTEFSLHAMYLEATALLRALALLMRAGITALPVHDAVVVPAIHALAAQTAMDEAFHATIGVPGAAAIQMSPEEGEATDGEA